MPHRFAIARNVVPAVTLALVACAHHATLEKESAIVPSYTVSIRSGAIWQASVRAVLPIESDSIWMSRGLSAPLTNGWATFVHDISATDGDGVPVRLQAVGKSTWRMPAGVRAPLHIAYVVDMQHDTVHWGVSAAFARSYVSDSALFFSGRTMFIGTEGMDSSRIRVRFDLPPSWRVASGYVAQPGDSLSYTSADLSDLWNNGTLVGRIAEQTLRVGGLDVSIAAPVAHTGGVSLVAESLAPVLAVYDSMMGGAPRGKLALLIGISPLQEGGETFAHSISISLHAEPSLDTKAKWAYLLSHELFHLWNGGAIRSSEATRTAWFLEGFTDYVAKLTLFKTGLSTRDELLAQLARSFDRYDAVKGAATMRDGGAAKSANYSLLYFGGTVVALVVDVEGRDHTNGVRGLPDVLRGMYATFGSRDSSYTYDDIVAASSAGTGVDMTGFFARHVAGGDKILVDDYLTRIGLSRTHHDSASVIRWVDHPLPQASLLRSAILGK